LCIFVIIGIALLAGNPAPTSVNTSQPEWFVTLWKAQLAVGATVALASLLMHRRSVSQLILSLGIERFAMLWFGSATLTFPVVLAQTGQRPALTIIGYALAYGVGALVWAWMLTRALRKLGDTP
jgi:hypothetical protein